MMKEKQSYIDLPSEDSSISLTDSILQLKFDVKHKAGILYIRMLII